MQDIFNYIYNMDENLEFHIKVCTFYEKVIPYLFNLPPWALIKFLDLESGCLFEVGAYSRVGAY